jgi:uncharacterized protein involved in response to NO
LAIASSLTADRSFRWHVRRTHVAVSAHRLAVATLWVAASALALALGYVVLTTALANLHALAAT